MKVVKNINNNVSLCLDDDGHEVVVFGKGIGFVKPPHEIGLDNIQRTFYDIDQEYLSVISQLDLELIDISNDIVDYAIKKIGNVYSSNVILTLADHIQFAIKRKKENINMKLPLYYEVQTLYPDEMKIGLFAISLISARLDVILPKEEAASITLHLIDYGMKRPDHSTTHKKSSIEEYTNIIENVMQININKKGFNYSRFVTHMYYLLDRVKKHEKLNTNNANLLDFLKDQYPKSYHCAIKIRDVMGVRLDKDELVYLILHINRLCSREDCHQ